MIIFDLIDVILKQPLEFLILAFAVVMIYKFFLSMDFSAREMRRMIKRDLADIPGNIYYGLFENYNTYSGLKTEKLDDALHLIQICRSSRTHTIDEFIKAKLEINNLDCQKIIKALRNLKRIKKVSTKEGYFWRKVN